jgi:diguanylate cyclase (GGDEF)-like protein
MVRQSRISYSILSIILFILMSFFDFKTGYRISFTVFYLIPIAVSFVFVGRLAGIIMALLSAGVGLVSGSMAGYSYLHSPTHYWNTLARMFFFLSAVLAIELKSSLKREKEGSRIDCLTGVSTRQHFIEMARIEIEKCRRYQRPLTVAFFDCDNFKHINDHFGHRVGDTVLRLFAQALRTNVRSIDIVARLGGDEFVVLLTETDYESSKKFIHRLQRLLMEVVQQYTWWPVTFSIGAVTHIKTPGSIDDILRKTDELMYSAKKSGKNKIKHEVYGEQENHYKNK